MSSKTLQLAFSSRVGHGSPPPMAALSRLRLLILKPGDWSDVRHVFEHGLHCDQSDTLQSLGIMHERKFTGLLSWSQRLGMRRKFTVSSFFTTYLLHCKMKNFTAVKNMIDILWPSASYPHTHACTHALTHTLKLLACFSLWLA